MTEYTTNLPRRAGLLVYICGIEVPVIDVTVSTGVWELPRATVNMAPDKELLRLGREDRVQVQIFYLDHFFSDSDLPKETPEFCLLYDGEIVGWQYRNTAAGRAISFDLACHAEMLNYLYGSHVHTFDSLVTGLSSARKEGVGAPVSQLQDPLVFPATLFYRGLVSSDKRFIKRPFDFVENIFKMLMGSETSDVFNSTVARNLFGRWCRLTNTHNRWAPCPYVENEDITQETGGIFPVLKAAQSEAGVNAIVGRLAAVGVGGTFWTQIGTLFSNLLYEISANPVAPAVAYDLVTGKILGPPLHSGNRYDKPEGVGRPLEDPLKPTRVLNYITKPPLLFTVPPICNTLFPSFIKNIGYIENYAGQPTRTYLQSFDATQYVTNGDAPLRTVGFPKGAYKALQARQTNPAYEPQNFLSWPEEFYKGILVNRVQTPPWFYFLMNAYNTPQYKDRMGVELPYLLSVYVTFEHYRARAAASNGAVEMVFNPYVVAGYPAVVLDAETTAAHFYAYVTNVTHRISSRDMSTTIQYTAGQMLEDFFESLTELKTQALNEDGYAAEQKRIVDLLSYKGVAIEGISAATTEEDRAVWDLEIQKIDAALLDLQTITTEAIVAAPLHPIPSLRARFQTAKGADEFYRRNFYRNSETKQNVVFNWETAFSVRHGDNTPEAIAFSVGDKVITSNTTTTSHSTPEYQLKGKLKGMAGDHDSAMTEVSRPVCTLEEYIDFHGDRGVRIGKVAPSGEVDSKGATYYRQILMITPNRKTAQVQKEPGTVGDYGNRENVDLLDTRSNWVEKLVRYRQKVYNDLHPHKA